jgi:hypothetical protein
MCASPDEFAGLLGYIVSAILIPVGELAGRDRELSHDRPIVAAGAATLSFAASNPPDDNKEHFSRGVARKGVAREDFDGGGATVRVKCVGRN